jgi:hypothetical protein
LAEAVLEICTDAPGFDRAFHGQLNAEALAYFRANFWRHVTADSRAGSRQV